MPATMTVFMKKYASDAPISPRHPVGSAKAKKRECRAPSAIRMGKTIAEVLKTTWNQRGLRVA